MRVGPTGLYVLASDNEGGAYQGLHPDEWVLIVGKGTKDERLFLKKGQITEAGAYARDCRRGLVSIKARDLPAEAMLKLFGE